MPARADQLKLEVAAAFRETVMHRNWAQALRPFVPDDAVVRVSLLREQEAQLTVTMPDGSIRYFRFKMSEHH